MKRFIAGMIVAAGVVVLGKSMYELGRNKGQKECLGVLEFITKVKESVKKEES